LLRITGNLSVGKHPSKLVVDITTLAKQKSYVEENKSDVHNKRLGRCEDISGRFREVKFTHFFPYFCRWALAEPVGQTRNDRLHTRHIPRPGIGNGVCLAKENDSCRVEDHQNQSDCEHRRKPPRKPETTDCKT